MKKTHYMNLQQTGGKKKYQIYCDLDGVLVDFVKGYKKLTGIDLVDYQSSKEFWTPIDAAGHEFWEHLEWTFDGLILWTAIRKQSPVVLSAPSRHDSSVEGKTKWLEKHLPGVPFILTPAVNKQKYANENHILIDDVAKNIEQWIFKGGVGILHTSAKNTIEELRKYNL